jgi:hypothetical protein
MMVKVNRPVLTLLVELMILQSGQYGPAWAWAFVHQAVGGTLSGTDDYAGADPGFLEKGTHGGGLLREKFENSSANMRFPGI